MHVVVKNKKYLEGHGYSTLNGYNFSWTKNLKEARKMNKLFANEFALLTNGKIIKLTNLK